MNSKTIGDNMTREIFYADAIKEAMVQEMHRDERVYVMGEDVGTYGGVFGVTVGMQKEFDKMRVRNTPLSEAAILGEAVGAAIYGLRPVPEIQFCDFVTCGMSQVVDLMSNYHYRNGVACPVTVRLPAGGMLHIGNFHSNCWENWFAHVAGLKIVVPSSAYDAKGLLVSAIRDPNPVLYFEQKRLYRLQKDHVPEELYEIEFGKANVIKEGADITIISYGNMMYEIKACLNKLEDKKIDVEVIDLRTLVPFDKETVLKSFKKTNRCLIVHEAKKSSGFGGEIAAMLTEEAFDHMAAPILRLGSKHMPIPMNPVLEKYYLPTQDDIILACEKLMKF